MDIDVLILSEMLTRANSSLKGFGAVGTFFSHQRERPERDLQYFDTKLINFCIDGNYEQGMGELYRRAAVDLFERCLILHGGSETRDSVVRTSLPKTKKGQNLGVAACQALYFNLPAIEKKPFYIYLFLSCSKADNETARRFITSVGDWLKIQLKNQSTAAAMEVVHQHTRIMGPYKPNHN